MPQCHAIAARTGQRCRHRALAGSQFCRQHQPISQTRPDPPSGLHPAQQAIAAHPARFKVLACGRRFGKTTLAIRALGDAASGTALPYAYFAPTYKMLKAVWRELKHTLAPLTTFKSEHEHRLELASGGAIDCWSLHNPDAPRGRKYAGIVVDEAARLRDGAAVWTAVLRPLLTDYQGWALLVSTPAGKNHFWEWYRLGIDPLHAEWAAWNYPTTANPHIDPAEVESARVDVPDDIFRQEFLGEFLESGGQVFRRVRPNATLGPIEPYAGNFVAGVDWGQTDDFTVIIILDAATGQMVAMDRFNQVGWAVQRGRLMALAEKWRPQMMVCELNAIGSPNFEALQAEGLPVVGFTTTASSKSPLIESLVLAFERDEIAIYNDALLVAELEAYVREVNPYTQRSRYGAAAGHDDMVIALALAWWGLLRWREGGKAMGVGANLFFD